MKKRTKKRFEEQKQYLGKTCHRCGFILKSTDLGNICANYIGNYIRTSQEKAVWHYKCPIRPIK